MVGEPPKAARDGAHAIFPRRLCGSPTRIGRATRLCPYSFCAQVKATPYAPTMLRVMAVFSTLTFHTAPYSGMS